MRLCHQLHHAIIQNPRIIQVKPWRRGVNIRPIGVKLGLRILLNLLRALVPWRLPAQPPPAQMRSNLLESNSMFCQGGQLARQTKRHIAPQVALASCKRQVGNIRHISGWCLIKMLVMSARQTDSTYHNMQSTDGPTLGTLRKIWTMTKAGHTRDNVSELMCFRQRNIGFRNLLRRPLQCSCGPPCC